MRIGIAPGAYIPSLAALTDDSIEGVFRSIGDAGAGPNNTTGYTLLSRAGLIEASMEALRMAQNNMEVNHESDEDLAVGAGSNLEIGITLGELVTVKTGNFAYWTNGTTGAYTRQYINGNLHEVQIWTGKALGTWKGSFEIFGDPSTEVYFRVVNETGGGISIRSGLRLVM